MNVQMISLPLELFWSRGGAVKYNTVSIHDQENGEKGLFFCGLDRELEDHVEDIKNSYFQTGYFFLGGGALFKSSF